MKTVAIIGRPNVGKSRLFNRIIGRRSSIVDDRPGVTRDRIEHVADHRGRAIRWIDTGGIGLEDDFGAMISLQTDVAIAAANALILVVDGREGLAPLDAEIARKVRGRKPVLVAVNKCDRVQDDLNWTDFAVLGFEEIMPVSAEHGRGVGDLAERAVELTGEDEDEETGVPVTKVAIVGRPNVGKSSLLNAILGQDRVIVSDIPGTTRDAVEAAVELPQGRIAIVDTAGIRKKRTHYTRLESVMVGRSRKAVESSDVTVVVADAAEGMLEQDVRLVAAVLAFGRGCVLALNKWDIVDEKNFDAKVKTIRRLLGSEAHVPIVSISALKRLRVRRLLEVALKVGENARRHIATPELNRILSETAQRAPRGIRFKYGIQRSVAPPSFLVFGAAKPPRSLELFLRSALRASGGYDGVPIVVEFMR